MVETKSKKFNFVWKIIKEPFLPAWVAVIVSLVALFKVSEVIEVKPQITNVNNNIIRVEQKIQSQESKIAYLESKTILVDKLLAKDGSFGRFTTAGNALFKGNVGIGTSAPQGPLEIVGPYTTSFFGGNLGVGSSAPGQALTVNGTMSVSIGTTGVGYIPCCRSAVGTNCLIGYCTEIAGAVCTKCN